MNDSYYIRLGLTVRGPYSRSDLHELAARGGFSKAHEVSPDKKSWSSATGYPDLFPAARRPGSEKSTARNEMESREDGFPAAREDAVSDRTAGRPALADLRTGSGAGLQAAGESVVSRPMSPLTIWGMVTGPVGFALLLASTVFVVLSLRTSGFVPSQNPGLLILLFFTFLLGTAALILGHLSIRSYQRVPGSLKERNLIVIGLSCGYTIVILSIMYSLVLLVSSFT